MVRMIVVAAAAMGLMLFVAFVSARLLRARTTGLSIRMQVFLALGGIVGAFAFGLGLMVLDRIKARADLVGREAAIGEARAVAALVRAEMEASGSSLEQVAHRLRSAATRPEAPAPAGEEPDLALIDADGHAVLATGRLRDEPGTVSVAVPIEVHGRVVGQARVIKPTLQIRKTLADFAPTVLVISLLLGAVAAIAAGLIGRAIAAPIEALTRYAERVSSGELRARPPRGQGREVKRLAGAIDSMRRELQGRPFVEAFAADLSHELKNPVAAIRASAEVLRDGALDEPEEAARFVARILESTSRIEALLGDLLSLARLEARGVEAADEVDLGAQAEAAVATARERGADVELVCDGEGRVRGDAHWLARALENLVDNARLHGDGGTIRIDIGREGANLVCRVSNPGQVSQGVRGRIFRRFVTTRAAHGGTGLGLAIVRAIAEAHGGHVECTALGPPEVEFRFVVPAA